MEKIIYKVSDLLPHTHPMILLDELIDYSDTFTEGLVKIHENSILIGSDQMVPAWVGIEYMAQTIGLYAGLKALKHNQKIRLGFLIGTRNYISEVQGFDIGQQLLVRADEDYIDSGMGDFKCSIADRQTKQILIRADLKVYQPDNIEEFLQ